MGTSEEVSMNVSRLLTTALAVTALAPASASAQSINTPPYGPGTEARPPTRRSSERVVEGWQASAQLGGGFTDTYGVGLGARLGYTLSPGVYVGGAVTHYFGNSVNTAVGNESAHATFFGGEVGYEFYPGSRWELRPYVFVGPSWIRTASLAGTDSKTRLALQPGALVAYHFGNFFVSGEGKVHATPDPTAFTLLAGAGVGFQ
jgi:hypothetical protein